MKPTQFSQFYTRGRNDGSSKHNQQTMSILSLLSTLNLKKKIKNLTEEIFRKQAIFQVLSTLKSKAPKMKQEENQN